MNKDKINPCFRLKMPSETEAHYQADKALWIEAMKRNGFIFTE